MRFTDQTFADANWSAEITFDSTPSGASFSAAQSGTARETRHDWTGPGGFVVGHLRLGAVYTPSLDGPIASVDHAFDLLFVDGSPGTSQVGHRLILRQGGTYYSTSGTTGLGIATLDAGSLHFEFQGLRPSDLGAIDFSASGGPIEFGYLTTNSEQFGNTLFTVSRIESWSVRVNKVCTAPAECDDGDPCTTDTCASGACRSTALDCSDADPCTTDACYAGSCTHVSLDCDDGKDCTMDTCAAGACQHSLAADEALVEAKIDALLALVRGPACKGQPLVQGLARKLGRRLKRARARIARADAATRASVVVRLLAKAEARLASASAVLAAAAADGVILPDCAAGLQAFLDEIGQCLDGVPRS